MKRPQRPRRPLLTRHRRRRRDRPRARGADHPDPRGLVGPVRDLYDLEAVRRSRHQVIDGKLLLLGLVELDPALAAALEPDGFLAALREGAEAHPRRVRLDRVNWHDDGPAKKDELDREVLAATLAARLRQVVSSSDHSFLVLLDGAWGAGKSSLLGFLKEDLTRSAKSDEDPSSQPGAQALRKDMARGPFIAVEVNAWREQRVGVQWWTLLRELRRAIRTDPGHSRLRAVPANFGDALRVRWTPSVWVAAATAVLAVAAVGVFARDKLDIANSVVGAATLLVAGVLSAYRFLVPDSGRAARSFVQTSTNPMREVQELFARTLARTEKPVVFLIDDLDRCDVEYVVEFLQVVQTLVREAPRETPLPAPRPRWWRRTRRTTVRPNVFGVVAADGEWIRTCFETHFSTFSGIADPGRPLGYLFLEKLFQLQVRVPSLSPTRQLDYLASLLAQQSTADSSATAGIGDRVASAPSGDHIAALGPSAALIPDREERGGVLRAGALRLADVAVTEAQEHLLTQFGNLLERNPRNMKLFVNAYGIQRPMLFAMGQSLTSEQVALWSILEARWPQLADHLRQYPTHVSGAGAPAEISSLLALEEVKAVIGHQAGGPVTADLIRHLTGAG